MGVLTYPNLGPGLASDLCSDRVEQLTPYESASFVSAGRSTALAHRFMVRRALSRRGGAGEPAPARVPDLKI